MGTDITVFANHAIDFSSNNLQHIAENIKYELNNSYFVNQAEIRPLIRSYYDWQGYDDIQSKWHEKIDNWTGNDWNYVIDCDLSSFSEICYHGPFYLRMSFTDKHIKFHDPGYRYHTFFGLEKKDRDEWRKYYYQYISLFGGDYALYLPDQGEVAWEFTEKIYDCNLHLEKIIEGLIKKYGPNKIGINEFSFDENVFIDPPYYFIDRFDDLK